MKEVIDRYVNMTNVRPVHQSAYSSREKQDKITLSTLFYGNAPYQSRSNRIMCEGVERNRSAHELTPVLFPAGSWCQKLLVATRSATSMFKRFIIIAQVCSTHYPLIYS